MTEVKDSNTPLLQPSQDITAPTRNCVIQGHESAKYLLWQIGAMSHKTNWKTPQTIEASRLKLLKYLSYCCVCPHLSSYNCTFFSSNLTGGKAANLTFWQPTDNSLNQLSWRKDKEHRLSAPSRSRWRRWEGAFPPQVTHCINRTTLNILVLCLLCHCCFCAFSLDTSLLAHSFTFLVL